MSKVTDWPYDAGYKPLLHPAHRPWAMHLPNGILNQLLLDGETLVGDFKAQRVPLLNNVTDDMLVERIAAKPPEDE